MIFKKRKIIAQSFEHWSEHTELEFIEVCDTCEFDLELDFIKAETWSIEGLIFLNLKDAKLNSFTL